MYGFPFWWSDISHLYFSKGGVRTYLWLTGDRNSSQDIFSSLFEFLSSPGVFSVTPSITLPERFLPTEVCVTGNSILSLWKLPGKVSLPPLRHWNKAIMMLLTLFSFDRRLFCSAWGLSTPTQKVHSLTDVNKYSYKSRLQDCRTM